ncbi:MAG: BlaI/MecI/CopY family transcriptional regulator [Oscillibacter sp.]|nr:BlaI/MecI/CopY family transcriptional regulator [Oscillibacter sp.]
MNTELSNSEWKLMRRLWDHSPSTITELTAALREETGWSKHTIITMLSRLEAKGAVRHQEGGRAKRYFPALRREDAVQNETESFLSKVYGGSLGLMMSAMVESRRLTEADIAELSAILDKAGGENT